MRGGGRELARGRGVGVAVLMAATPNSGSSAFARSQQLEEWEWVRMWGVEAPIRTEPDLKPMQKEAISEGTRVPRWNGCVVEFGVGMV